MNSGYKIQKIDNIHFFVKWIVFRQVSNQLFDFISVFVDRGFVKTDVSIVGIQKTGHNFHCGGFTGSVRPQKT